MDFDADFNLGQIGNAAPGTTPGLQSGGFRHHFRHRL